MHGTFSFPINLPAESYDPWALPYGKAPPALHSHTVQRTFPLQDFRDLVIGERCSIENSRNFLRDYGFTAVKYATALNGRSVTSCDVNSMNDIYYPEIQKLVESVTGCSHVFVTDSVLRRSGAHSFVTAADWKHSVSPTNDVNAKAVSGSSKMHKSSPWPPARLPHWDMTPAGARQVIRNRSEEIVKVAHERGIIACEDAIRGSPRAVRSGEHAIEQNYKGPRYATFSVWRPLRRVTRDPLAMASYDAVKRDMDFLDVSHVVKQPGIHGDWLRELATLKAKDKIAPLEYSTSGLRWFYISEQNVDEVLIIKSFDSAALLSQRELTGEAPGVAHGSPDIGDAAYGGARESIEVRVVAFW